MGFVGKIVSFAFFLMVVIAAITSVMSLIEVATQFVIQKLDSLLKVFMSPLPCAPSWGTSVMEQ